MTRSDPKAPPAETVFGLTKFLDPLPVPRLIRTQFGRELAVEARRAQVRLHSQLPPTSVWAYEGSFPGPTIEVESGREVRISWDNAIDGPMPLVAVQAPQNPVSSAGQFAPAVFNVDGSVSVEAAVPDTDPSTRPGYRNPDGSLPPGVSIIEGVDAIPAYTVTHLHGADTPGGNDGWAHNAVLHGGAQRTVYPNRQRAMGLWYHDHAMAVTRFNVHAGLVGQYWIRDDEERRLGLPDGRHEIPLTLTDRNLDTDAQGRLTGQMLYKVGYITVAEQLVQLPMSGPFNLVNGVIWPHCDVEPRWYRFRVVNACNSRFYRLNLVDESGSSMNHLVRQIGTDGGLLPAPAELPEDGLRLAPAERADLLIDFGEAAVRGRRLRLRDSNVRPSAQDPDEPVTEPDLIELRVADRPGFDRFELPAVLSPSYYRLEHGTTLPDDHDHVFIGLIPPGAGGDGHAQMWELSEISDEPGDTFPREGIVQIDDPATHSVRTFQKVAQLFDESLSIFIDRNRWAVWNLVHFGAAQPSHPIHIHLTQFQILFRRRFQPQFDVPVGGTIAPASNFEDVPLADYEKGWKDTFIVDPGQWVSVAGRFGESTGEFMYHCHILDHEDMGMMRPFVVAPAEVMRFHEHPGGGHDHHR